MRYQSLFFSFLTLFITKSFFEISEQHHEEVSLGNLKRFQFRELQMATSNFSNKNIIGKGGFGNVYKGYLRDGTVVAVKRLKDGNASGGEIQFQTEVEMISLAVHRNLLRLYGFCMTASERLLVYPYMSNGSVASRLKGKKNPQDFCSLFGILFVFLFLVLVFISTKIVCEPFLKSVCNKNKIKLRKKFSVLSKK